MAQATAHIVVSVEYRLAPEHRFPVPLEDCYAATRELYTNQLIINTDPEEITIVGDSAGEIWQLQYVSWQETGANLCPDARF